MATIDKRGDVYRVQIRKRGHATINQSFKLKWDAVAFVRVTEGELTSGSLSVPGKQTFNQAIDAYIEHRANWKQLKALGESVALDLTKYQLGVLQWWRERLSCRPQRVR